MPRKAIHRDLHHKNAIHTKPYSTVNGNGLLKVSQKKEEASEPAEKVSKASEPKLSDEPKNALRTLETNTEADEGTSEVKSPTTTSKKKTSKRGRPRSTTKKAED